MQHFVWHLVEDVLVHIDFWNLFKLAVFQCY